MLLNFDHNNLSVSSIEKAKKIAFEKIFFTPKYLKDKNIITINNNGKVLYANKSTIRLLGNTVIGKELNVIFNPNSNDEGYFLFNSKNYRLKIYLNKINWDNQPALIASITATSENRKISSIRKDSVLTSNDRKKNLLSIIIDKKKKIRLFKSDSISNKYINPDKMLGKDFTEVFPSGEIVTDINDSFTGKITEKTYKISGNLWNVKIAPYIIRDNFIDGSILEIDSIIPVSHENHSQPNEKKYEIESAVQYLPQGIISIDFDGIIRYMNKQAEILSGWSLNDASDKPLSEILIVLKESDNNLVHYSRNGKYIDYSLLTSDNLLILSKHNIKRNVSIKSNVMKDCNDRVIGMVISLQDITNELHFKREIQKTQKLESIGLLAGGLAHDFNNILMGIVGNIDLAKMLTKDEAVLERLSQTEKACFRAKSITRQLLTFAQGVTPVTKKINLKNLLQNSIKFSLKGTNISPIFDLCEDMKYVDVDEIQINQVIYSIIQNVIESMPDGGNIWISSESVIISDISHMPLSNGQYVKVSIKDEGIGIKKEDLPLIFDPYFSSDSASIRMGLPTSFAIIKNHGGYLLIDSDYGVGTITTFYLPTITDKSPNIISLENGIESKASIGNLINSNNRTKVLIYDTDIDYSDSHKNIVRSNIFDIYRINSEDDLRSLFENDRCLDNNFDSVILKISAKNHLSNLKIVDYISYLRPKLKIFLSCSNDDCQYLESYEKFNISGILNSPIDLVEINEVFLNFEKSY